MKIEDKIKALKIKKEKILEKYGDRYLDYLNGKKEHYETGYKNTVTSIVDILKTLEKHIGLIDKEIDKLEADRGNYKKSRKIEK